MNIGEGFFAILQLPLLLSLWCYTNGGRALTRFWKVRPGSMWGHVAVSVAVSQKKNVQPEY